MPFKPKLDYSPARTLEQRSPESLWLFEQAKKRVSFGSWAHPLKDNMTLDGLVKHLKRFQDLLVEEQVVFEPEKAIMLPVDTLERRVRWREQSIWVAGRVFFCVGAWHQDENRVHYRTFGQLTLAAFAMEMIPFIWLTLQKIAERTERPAHVHPTTHLTAVRMALMEELMRQMADETPEVEAVSSRCFAMAEQVVSVKPFSVRNWGPYQKQKALVRSILVDPKYEHWLGEK